MKIILNSTCIQFSSKRALLRDDVTSVTHAKISEILPSWAPQFDNWFAPPLRVRRTFRLPFPNHVVRSSVDHRKYFIPCFISLEFRFESLVENHESIFSLYPFFNIPLANYSRLTLYNPGKKSTVASWSLLSRSTWKWFGFVVLFVDVQSDCKCSAIKVTAVKF